MKKKVLCVGTIIVDIINEPIEKILGQGEGVSTAIEAHPGGNSFNVSADLVKLGVPGDQVICLGTIGEDLFGEMFERELLARGIVSGLQKNPEKGTSKIIILQVKGEERRYHLDPGPNPSLDYEYIIEEIRKHEPHIFYLGEAASLGRVMTKLAPIFKEAKKVGAITVFDTLIMGDMDWRPFFQAAPYIDVLHGNDIETRKVTGVNDLKEVVSTLKALSIKMALVSQGGKALHVGFGKQYLKLPTFQVESIDPTGAGDAFTAGVITGLLALEGKTIEDKMKGQDLDSFLLVPRAAGALAVTQLGCTRGIDKKAIDELISQKQFNS